MSAHRPARFSGRLRWPILATALGLLIALGVPVGWSIIGHPTAIHQLGPGTTAKLAEDPTPEPSKPSGEPTATAAAAAASTSPPSQDPAIPVSATGGNPLTAPAESATPSRISISALAVNSPVVAEGVDAAGEMNIPTDIHTIGWYQWSSAPGASAGSIVMVGHVDSAKQGLGSFFNLKTLAQGALVTITIADGKTWNYHVVAREEFPKTNVPLAAIFDQSGAPRLILATCGGAFDEATRSYKDNIVITALPVSP
jgi:hypothetical protein